MHDARRAFVDTSVLLYSIDPCDPIRQVRAAEWLQHLWASGTGSVSWLVLHEFYVNATRKLAVPPQEARFLVDTILTWHPVDCSAALIHRAWHWANVAHLSYWDALILAAAGLAGCDVLLSEDFQAGRRFDQIQVINRSTATP